MDPTDGPGILALTASSMIRKLAKSRRMRWVPLQMSLFPVLRRQGGYPNAGWQKYGFISGNQSPGRSADSFAALLPSILVLSMVHAHHSGGGSGIFVYHLYGSGGLNMLGLRISKYGLRNQQC